MATEEEIKQYAARLYERRSEGIILKLANIQIGDWQPKANECHSNVSICCELDSSYTPARGWFYFDFLNVLPGVQFLAHSAIRAPDGALYDITPSMASQQYPFIVAEEPEADYAALIEGQRVVRIWHMR